MKTGKGSNRHGIGWEWSAAKGGKHYELLQNWPWSHTTWV